MGKSEFCVLPYTSFAVFQAPKGTIEERLQMYNGITTVRFCPVMRCEGSNDRLLRYYNVQDYPFDA